MLERGPELDGGLVEQFPLPVTTTSRSRCFMRGAKMADLGNVSPPPSCLQVGPPLSTPPSTASAYSFLRPKSRHKIVAISSALQPHHIVRPCLPVQYF